MQSQQPVISQDLYEDFVLSDDKQNLIDKMIQGTTQHFFFSMLYSLSQEQIAERIEKQNELMKQYKKKDEGYYFKNIQLKILLNQLQSQNGEEEIKQTIKEINKILQVRVDQFGEQKKGVIQQMEDEKEEKEGLSKINKQVAYDKCNITKNDYTLEKIRKLTDLGIDKLDPQILFTLEKEQFEIVTYYLQKKQDLYRIDNLPLLLLQFQQYHFEGQRNFDQLIETFQLQKLSIQQIEEIAELIPDLYRFTYFVSVLLQKKFPFNQQQLSKGDKNQVKTYLDLIKQKVQYLESKNIKFQVNELVQEYIKISSYFQEFDFDMFFKVLKIQNIDNEHKKNVFSKKELKKYLKQYIKSNDQLDLLYEFSGDKNFIDKLKMKLQLLQGNNIENINKHFSEKEIQQLESKKILKILKSNNRVFEVNEAIDLEVKIKNINRIEVKVFQLNSEQYYLKNMRKFDGNIDLGGLIANYQTEFKFDLKAIEKKVSIFNLDSPQIKEPGVFLIEFIGNGLSSRIVIQKGKIYLNQKLSLTGIKVQLFDEKLQICKEKRVGIYVKNKFIKAKENGEIEIPFQSVFERCEVVAVNDKLSQLVDLELLDEEYSFKCNLIYNNESIIENNLAKFILQPMLLLHELQASLKMITAFKVTVNQTNDKGIINKQVIDITKDSLLPNTDIELSVQIVKGVSRLTFQYQVTIQSISKGSLILNAADKDILINNHIDGHHYADNICCQYLKKNNQGYKIYLLGKTGEPKIDQLIKVKLVNTFYEDSNKVEEMVELKTDNKGAVELGHLINITHIYSEVQSAHFHVDSCKWTILNDNNYVRYNNITALQGQLITLPINTNDQLSLYQVDSQGSFNFIADMINNCLITQSLLTISNLNVGFYQVSINYSKFTINVIKGTLIPNTSIILSDDFQVNTITNPNYVNIQKVTLQDNSLSIQTNKQNVKINLIAFNFYDNSIKNVLDFLSGIHAPDQQVKQVNFPEAQIFNNKQLADELVYVLDRKSQQRFVGNNLNKPKILLNQQFNQNTQYGNENLSQGKDYLVEKNCQNNLMSCGANMSRNYMQQCFMKDQDHLHGQIQIHYQDYLNGDLKFLKNKSLILSNLKSDENGLVKVDIEIEKYQQVLVIMNDNNQLVYRVLDLQDKEIEVKNLVQQQMNEEEKCFISSRLHELVSEEQQVTMEDMNKVEFQIVDNLEQVLNLMNTIQEHAEIKDWEFLIKWESLDLLQKHKHYYKKSCHELNIFLYFKDRVYFDLYVSPFISNKMEKTFIDYFLLLNHSQLLTYLNSQSLSTLNPCELILFLNYIQRHSSEHFNQIYCYIDQQILKSDFTIFKKRFDTIINSNNNEFQVENDDGPGGGGGGPRQMNYMGSVAQAIPKQLKKTGGGGGGIVPSPKSCRMMASRKNEQEKSLNRYKEEIMMDDYDNDVLEEEEENLADKRKKYVKGYDQLEATKEYIEKQYIHKQVTKQSKDYNFNEFYQDYIKHLMEKKEKGFISQNFIMSTMSISEKILVLSLMDLQFNKVSHVFKNEMGQELKITAKSNMIVFKKEFKEGEKKLKQDILISQRLFDPKDKFTMEDDYRVEKEVQEFVVNKVYGCQLVITNCSVAEHLLQILYQIPENSMPVNSLDYIAQINKVISSFSTETFEFFFYFPKNGSFKLTPATVNRNNQTIAIAPLQTITVNLNRTKINTLNLHDILLSGTESDILNYIQQTNLFKNHQDLYNILYLFNQKSFYTQAIQILESKKFLNQDVLSYSIIHSDKLRFFQLLQFHTHNLQQFIYQYQNEFLKINKIQLKEYHPIMNARVHQMKDKQILNVQFREQYTEFLKYLAEKKQLENQDRIVLSYYLILQDRIEEAIKVFKKVDEGQLIECQIQYDYLKCYLDFYNSESNYEVSRSICDKYLDYPILHWRNSFYEVANLLAEYDGEQMEEQEILEDLQKNKKKQEEYLKLECENHQLVIEYMNISEVQLFLYKIDLEIIFSINPFMEKAEDNLLMLIPNSQFKLQLQESNMVKIEKIDIPEQFRNNNLHVMIQSDNKKSSITYLPNQLDIHIQEDMGQIRIYEKSNRKPLKSVYIKTFVKLKDNSVQFYKDGYTDLVGGFNYSDCTSNSDLITKVSQFSILISTDNFGSVIKQANPVNTLSHFDHNILKGKNQAKFNQRMIHQTQVYNQSKKDYKK